MVQQHVFLALAWIVFCVLHSLFAAHSFKQKIQFSFPGFNKYYRFAYTIFAFVSMIAVLIYQIKLTSPLLYIPAIWILIIGYSLMIIGAGIMLICIKKYFLSLSGIKSLFSNKMVQNNLRIDGIHKFVRHPLYLGTFLFIWGGFIVFPYLSLLISVSIITIYTLIGIRFEEKKLLIEFGEAYKNYMRNTPMILPSFK
jgi:protein-S-isoprenylcysteine O-methyltransferase Ste14